MSDSSEQALSHSMTDLMTSLAVIFILLLVVYMNHTYQETQQGSMKIKEELRNQINQELSKIKNSKVQAEDDPRDPLALIIKIQDDTLKFDLNKKDLLSNGRAFLGSFTPAIEGVVCAERNFKDVESILIQGFTDNSGGPDINLGLSQDRALEVMKTMYRQSGPRHSCFLRLASTNGMGSNDLQETPEKSRRVEFKIRVKSYEVRKALGDI
jgi:outer membrane protein OmpA-like peptidoglycan-associated protein